MRPTYLDHAASTPCDRAVMDVINNHMLSSPGNPSSIHAAGRRARAVLEQSRSAIAEMLGCASAREIVFTSGGTESNNLALRGIARARAASGRHIITTAMEHDSVLHTCDALSREGFRITCLAVDRCGRVRVEDLLAAVEPDTVLVSIMHGNNEIGTVQPIGELARAVKERRPDICFHTDAVQTVGQILVDIGELGVDMLTFTAHKFYGPQGIGGLYMREGVRIEPQLAGGGQECSLRSGTESVALAAGMAEALRIAVREHDERARYCREVRDRIARELLQLVPESHLNGPALNHPAAGRLPGNLNISFLGVTGEDLVLRLDRRGIQASTGSACAAAGDGISHVLKAIGVPRGWAKGALRLTFGEACRQMNPLCAATEIREVVEQLRCASYRPAPQLAGAGV